MIKKCTEDIQAECRSTFQNRTFTFSAIDVPLFYGCIYLLLSNEFIHL